MKNFQELDKTGGGTWTLTGAIGNNGGAAPLVVQVIGGTLVLTGNNANFNGSVVINPAPAYPRRVRIRLLLWKPVRRACHRSSPTMGSC